jgi:hypothetical protein
VDTRLLKRNGYMRERLLRVSAVGLIGTFYAMPITCYAARILRIRGILPG